MGYINYEKRNSRGQYSGAETILSEAVAGTHPKRTLLLVALIFFTTYVIYKKNVLERVVSKSDSVLGTSADIGSEFLGCSYNCGYDFISKSWDEIKRIFREGRNGSRLN